MSNEVTSKKVATIAAAGLKDPLSLTREEIKSVCASALTQAPDNDDEPDELTVAALDFIEKVDSGKARSIDSYNKFKCALGL